MQNKKEIAAGSAVVAGPAIGVAATAAPAYSVGFWGALTGAQLTTAQAASTFVAVNAGAFATGGAVLAAGGVGYLAYKAHKTFKNRGRQIEYEEEILPVGDTDSESGEDSSNSDGQEWRFMHSTEGGDDLMQRVMRKRKDKAESKIERCEKDL